VSQLRKVTAKESKGEKVVWLLRGNVHLAAGALAVAGCVLLFASSGRHTLFREADPLLGLSNRTLLALLGLLHLSLSVWLLATNDLMAQGLTMLWLGANSVAYSVGMAWLKAATPLPVLKLVAWKLGARPTGVDMCWKLMTAYLVVGSLAHLVLHWWRLKRLASDAFMRRWKQSREQGASTQRSMKRVWREGP
jgi:hypothetical protein